MQELTTDHYRMLLGLDENWSVDDVDFSFEQKRVTITISFAGSQLCCSHCNAACPQADLAPERKWRHLDTMQFTTEIHARTPRTQCKACGVKTIQVPWADRHSRFTLLFEAFAIDVLLACANVKRAAALLNIDWSTAHKIMQRAVERGLAGRQIDEVPHVGIDEKSFGSGQDYVTVMTDIDQRRVLDVVEGRTTEATDRLWSNFPQEMLEKVRAVAMDMWQPFIKSTRSTVPDAEIVHDKFHVAKYLNDALDKVRRRENKQLREEDEEDKRLTGTKNMLLFAKKNLPSKYRQRIKELQESDLKTAHAWSMKENFRRFWRHVYSTSAEKFFHLWYEWVIESGIAPMIKVAKMLDRHLSEILSYFRHRITNAINEGFNSKIQNIKSNARGFRAFENYRMRILFYCGKLNLKPKFTH